MSLNSTALNVGPITGGGRSLVTVRVSGRRADVQYGSLTMQLFRQGRSTCTFTLLDPELELDIGSIVDVAWHNEFLFGGILNEITRDAIPAITSLGMRTVQYVCTAIGWESLLERHVVSGHYDFTPADQIIRDAVARTVSQHGVLIGALDVGVVLSLVDAQSVRLSEFVRDIAEAAGGFVLISPEKIVTFRTTTQVAAPFVLTASVTESLEQVLDSEEYRNRQIVTVVGKDGLTLTITRDDTAQIAARQALEGGSGVHEDRVRIQHPTSNDALALERLAVSYAVKKLAVTGQPRRLIRARFRVPHLKIGDLLTVTVPGYDLGGVWMVTSLTITDQLAHAVDNLWFRTSCEATQVSAADLGLEGLLQIAQEGRAAIELPVALFPNSVVFNTAGTFEWIVPGTGDVQIEVNVAGAGGGGAAAFNTCFQGQTIGISADDGGAGGLGISFRTYPAGTVITITVGAGGAAGTPIGQTIACGPITQPGDGGSGTDTKAEQGAVLIARGSPGGGAVAWDLVADNNNVPGHAGAPGTGTGDITKTGGGSPGGIGGRGSVDPVVAASAAFPGSPGRVEIRY